MKLIKMMKVFWTILAVLLISGMGASLAHAKTPAEVLEPYRAYRTALDAGDADKATKYARTAYEAAREHLDKADPLIGTLAHNLADQLAEQPKEQIKLYRTAIDLGLVESEDDIYIMAQRWVAVSQVHALRKDYSKKTLKAAHSDVRKGWSFIQEHGLEDTTFGGEMMVMMGWTEASSNRVDKALNWYDRADAVFEGPNHTYFSLLEYTNKLLRGNTLITNDRDIEGAIALQGVMQNLEGELPADHPYVKDALHGWLWARSKIEMSDGMEAAEQAGVCKCWPYDEMSENAPMPILRFPPEMPRRAKRSGRVLFQFDVSREGSPENIRVLGYTEEGFVNPSLKALKQWKYEVAESIKDEDLKNLTTTITFRLATQRGAIIPEKSLKLLENPPAG